MTNSAEQFPTPTAKTGALSKVPAVTLGFWIIKILATTLGETGGDTVSMSWLGETTPLAGQGGLNGYLIGTALFGIVLMALVWLQVRARTFRPWLYWATIVASTTAGTTLADFSTGSVSVNTIVTPREETFYWITITFSQTLGTALGDWIADSGLGYGGGALVFGAGLLVLAAIYYQTAISHVTLFWAAFILTRPLGATVGDFLDKPLAKGGLELSRPIATAALLIAMAMLIVFIPQRPGRHPGADDGAAA
jgi:uncharacterized membrane-anchored protein